MLWLERDAAFFVTNSRYIQISFKRKKRSYSSGNRLLRSGSYESHFVLAHLGSAFLVPWQPWWWLKRPVTLSGLFPLGLRPSHYMCWWKWNQRCKWLRQGFDWFMASELQAFFFWRDPLLHLAQGPKVRKMNSMPHFWLKSCFIFMGGMKEEASVLANVCEQSHFLTFL